MTRRYIFGYLFHIFSIILFVLPITLLIIFKHDDWVTQKGDGMSIAVGVIIGIVYAVLVLKGLLKFISPKISFIISLAVFSAVFYFFDSIINDLLFISLSVLIGAILFFVFNAIAKRQLEIAKIFADEQIKMLARDNPRLPSKTLNAIK